MEPPALPAEEVFQLFLLVMNSMTIRLLKGTMVEV